MSFLLEGILSLLLLLFTVFHLHRPCIDVHAFSFHIHFISASDLF